MNARALIQTALQVLVALMITAGLAPAAGAYTEEEEQEVRQARMLPIQLRPSISRICAIGISI